MTREEFKEKYKEKYKENIIRMFDRIRSNHKGEKTCKGVNCEDCPFNGKVCNIGETIFRAYEAIEIVEEWVKEHPIKTNADKFKEMFGVEYDPINACIKHNIKCGNCPYYNYDGTCDVTDRFWNAEYNPTKEGEE